MPRLSRFRFRLRTLILLVAVVAGLLGGARFLRSLMAAIEANTWAGWSQDELVSRLGQPEKSYNQDFNALNAPRPAKNHIEMATFHHEGNPIPRRLSMMDEEGASFATTGQTAEQNRTAILVMITAPVILTCMN